MKVESSSVSPIADSTVFVIEIVPSARDVVRDLLQPNGCRIRSYISAEDFLTEFKPNGPACLLVDEQLPGMRGGELLRKLHHDGVRTPAVMVAESPSTPVTVEAMRHGAVNVLEKPCPEATLRAIVQSALEADAKRIEREKPARIARHRLEQLTPSEHEVLRMVLDGVPNKQIASRLGVCVRTIESRRSKIYQTAKVSSVAELVRFCVKAGVVDRCC